MTRLFIGFILGLMALPSLGRDVTSRFCRETAVSDEQICRVSHFQLAAHPDDFDGRLVLFTTVLRKVPEGPLRLYYSVEAANNEMDDDIIVISNEPASRVLIDKVSDGFVRVYGRFRARNANERTMGVGVISPVIEMFNEASPRKPLSTSQSEK